MAIASLLAARLFRLPEAYWAPITTLVVTQSSLGAALTVSWQRFFGTALGALVGAMVASRFGPHLLVFGIGVFLFGVAMRFGAGRLERLPLCGNYVRASAVDCAAGSSMEDRFSPVRGSIHRDCGCFDFCRGVAGTGSGGDEEKVMIGKWPVSDEWRRAPKMVILSRPVVGQSAST